jgi:lysophospholipase L1-like esterase
VFRLCTIFAVISLAVTLFSAHLIRGAWIKAKISTLSSPRLPVFAEANAKVPFKGIRARIILIGDSRIAKWPTSALEKRWDVINRGISGETVSQLALRFESDAISLNPDVIVIETGINDLVAASLMDDTAGRAVLDNVCVKIRQFAGRAAAAGSHVLVATIIPPARPEIWRLFVWKESLRAAVAEANQELRRAPMPDGASLLDLTLALDPGDDETLPDAYRLDTLHLNQEGYERLTVTLTQRIERILSPDDDK